MFIKKLHILYLDQHLQEPSLENSGNFSGTKTKIPRPVQVMQFEKLNHEL